jgi:hypothetical protein
VLFELNAVPEKAAWFELSKNRLPISGVSSRLSSFVFLFLFDGNWPLDLVG